MKKHIWDVFQSYENFHCYIYGEYLQHLCYFLSTSQYLKQRAHDCYHEVSQGNEHPHF